MTKLVVQHGPAKGQKINDSIDAHNVNGVIFSQNDEYFDSIYEYVVKNQGLSDVNCFLDPQFYYSTFDSSILKKLNDIESYPSNVTRRDWRKRNDTILAYLDYHAEKTKYISNTLITPGFYVDNIDWHFDYSVEIFNYCIEKYDFDHYALSLMIQNTFFSNKKNVEELVEELDDMCKKRDYIYLTICYDVTAESNYEEIDPNCLANLLYSIYQLRRMGFKIIMGYSFMNSILFSMLGCEYVASGWFNTLRKFQKNKFELVDTFGRRKKRYTSIPLLSYLMLDDLNSMLEVDGVDYSDLLSNSDIDNKLMTDEDSVSFVDLEHQYWESLTSAFNDMGIIGDIQGRISSMRIKIREALRLYKVAIDGLENKGDREAANRLKTASKHLKSWLSGLDIFETIALII